MIRAITSTALLFSIYTVSNAAITFSVTFTAQAMADYSAAEQQLFQDGIDFWDSVIDGHQDNVNRNFNLEVDSFNQAANPDGSITLGSAGPIGLTFSGVVAGANTSDGRYIIASGGRSRFNTNPAAGSVTASTIRHEIGHTLGIGTLWEDNEVYNDGDTGTGNRTLAGGIVGQYAGANALAAYQAEFDAAATFIPIEQSGGPGTANGHWDESDDFGQTATGITDAMGRDFRDELMTGYAAPTEANTFLSETSRQSLVDIGFTLEAVPEPSSTSLLGLGSFALILRRRR